MELTLVLPGALLPAEFPAPQRVQLLTGCPVPALQKLLSRSHACQTLTCDTATVTPLEYWLAQCFGIPPGLSAPYGARLDEVGFDTDLCWQLQPVHLQLARDHLVLVDPALLNLLPEESAALQASIEPLLTELNWQVRSAQPQRWYAQPPAPLKLHAGTAAAAIGRNIEPYLPQGDDARTWKRLMNEVQMIWHTHPVNAAREARGELPVNSLWLYGGAQTAAPTPQRKFDAVYADDFTVRAVTHASDAVTHAAQPTPQLAQARTLHVDTRLHTAWMGQDWHAWRENLHALEQDFFAPLLAVLDRRILKRLTLVLCGETQALEIQIVPGDLWKLWRRAELSRVLAEPDA
ncbi:MAG: hypothetical protein EPO06_11280 [Burkholderiaceae bacterium]|nr:MAG: hypothetical protein EPO06_11280 [Burkholderiaceae bacterium]